MNLPLLREPEPGDLLKQVRLLGQPVSDEAFDLLRERRRIRRRGVWCVAPAGIVGAVVIVAAVRQAWSGGAMLSGIVTVDLIAVAAVLVRHEVIRRAERNLGAYLPRRLSRTHAVSVQTVFGLRILALLAAVVALHVVMTLALVARGDTRAAIGFGVICTASYVLAFVALVQVTGRAVLAVDPLTLTVDDRLRTRDACTAYVPMFLAAGLFSVITLPSTDMTLFYLSFGAYVLVIVDGVVRESRWSQSPAWFRHWRRAPGSQQ